MTRMEMMDSVIKTRGFEDELTIWFCKIAESRIPKASVELAYKIVMKK